MKLKEYLDVKGIKTKAFAQKAQISLPCVYNIFKEKHDLHLSIAVRIHHATEGFVTYEDLNERKEPFKKDSRKGNRKKQLTNPSKEE